MTLQRSSRFLGAIALIAICICCVQCNNYDPHVAHAKGPWFEGWYNRIVDAKNGRSIAVVVASLCKSGMKCNQDQNLPGFVSIGVQVNRTAKLEFYDEFPAQASILVNGQPPLHEPDFSSPPNFTWSSSNNGYFSPTSIQLALKSHDIEITAEFSKPVFWNPSVPGEGPEGGVMLLPLQQHWFVYSLASATTYKLRIGDKYYQGSGFTHQEKNWGSSFPKGWVWAQGMSDDGVNKVVVSGGKVPIGPVDITAWLIGYRSNKLSWNFRPQSLEIATANHTACSGFFSIRAIQLTKTVEITMQAPRSSFAGISAPYTTGYIRNAAYESYATVTVAKAYEDGQLIDQIELEGAALEFGGEWKCEATD